MNLFGLGKKKPAAQPRASPQEAISLLESKMETLAKREQFLNTKIELCKKEALAKKKKGDKTGALIALKKSNRYADEAKKMQGTVMNLESQKMALESASINVETISAFDASNKALANIHKNMDPERIDDIMEDMEDQRDISNQISEALTRNTEDVFEDEDLLAELEGLEDELEMVDEEAPTIPTKAQPQQTTATTTPAPEAVFNFPNAPQGQLQQQPVKETEDERAIRELQESMLA
jgi:charged multivesicular body protein 4